MLTRPPPRRPNSCEYAVSLQLKLEFARASPPTSAQAFASDENTTVTVSGTITSTDVVSLTVEDSRLAAGEETVSYTVQGGDTATNVATGIKNAVNANSNLQAIGIGATSSGAVVTLNTYTYFTSSVTGAATETITLAGANRGSVRAAIGGTPTTSDVLTITAHNPTLPSEQQAISYTVVSNDTPLSIAQGLATAINGNSNLQALGVKADQAAILEWSQVFSANAPLPTGASSAAVSATDGNNNSKTNNLAVGVNGGGSSTLTFDANGNMTSDGTNSYSWDAENRLIRITYLGVNNFTDFIFNALNQNVKIVETISGSVSSTKQFIWCGDDGRCEERDASGNLAKRFMGNLGETSSGSSYVYITDQNDSLTELIDSSGNIQAQYRFDPFGRATKIQGSLDCDFLYAAYYFHPRSGLNFALMRAYSSTLGRWLNRDPIEEFGGINLFAYVGNEPIDNTDPSGLFAITGFEPCQNNPPRPPGPKSKFPWIWDDPDDDPPQGNRPTYEKGPGGRSAGGAGGGGDPVKRYPDPQRGKGRSSKGTGKQRSTDTPSWFSKGTKRLPSDTKPETFAERIMNEKYGKGKWAGKGPGTEYNRIKKWASRNLF